ncbi:hypothetical protein KFK09_011290 [Dendrobium nobile]|uniref:Uncharacterized protein n=1 Tax=Dendrobium nobile TaxID=94219 RepID=A0A8T3BFA7_DENNO|nr:hypothetical protein KFK09_011290 [Dendrobium nobile]
MQYLALEILVEEYICNILFLILALRTSLEKNKRSVILGQLTRLFVERNKRERKVEGKVMVMESRGANI